MVSATATRNWVRGTKAQGQEVGVFDVTDQGTILVYDVADSRPATDAEAEEIRAQHSTDYVPKVAVPGDEDWGNPISTW